MASHQGLDGFHIAAGAEMQDYFGLQIVSTYGRLALEYASVFRFAGFMDLRHRGVIRVAGRDRISFLNSILTAELVARETGKQLPAGEVRFAFLLDRKGRVQAEMNVLVMQDCCWLEMDARVIPSVLRELEKFHFREDVSMVADEGVGEIGIFGPAGSSVIAALAGMPAGSLNRGCCTAIRIGNQEAIVWHEMLGSVDGCHLILPAAAMPDVWAEMVGRYSQEPQEGKPRAFPMGWAAYNVIRIEAGRAVLGIDYDETFLPAETGQLERAVSFSKGCYPGQEIVARMKSHDQCARRVVGLEIADSALPAAGEKLLDAEGNAVGAVTSSTISPRLSNRAIALACVRKGFFDPGVSMRVAAEGAMHGVRVAATPFAL